MGTEKGQQLGRPVTDRDDGPKITLFLTDVEGSTLRRVKQLGINHVCMSGPRIPWSDDEVRSRVDKLAAMGMSLGNMKIDGFPDAIYGRSGRNRDIEKVCESIRAAGRAGIPVVEYNFYAHRAIEGYYDAPGRGGAVLRAFDYEKIRDLPPLPDEGAHTLDEMWDNVTYFLQAVMPVAEKSGVRMALHPNDPPAPISRGSEQIMGDVPGWKRFVEIVPSPNNGITFDCGVTREMGYDPVEVCRYFGERDQINHVHFRNVKTDIPREKYTEVFLDEGEVDMFAVMAELVRQKYPRLVYPEHPPVFDADREHPFGGISSSNYTGFAYTVGYARAMLQAASARNPVPRPQANAERAFCSLAPRPAGASVHRDGVRTPTGDGPPAPVPRGDGDPLAARLPAPRPGLRGAGMRDSVTEFPTFRRHTIYQGPPAERPTCVGGDIDGDGQAEFVIATRNPRQELHWFGRTETGEWEPHVIDDSVDSIGVGGVLVDVT